jgi:F-type H+-transporting ATPase subunit epsilon
MKQLTVNVVSPEKSVFSGEADSVACVAIHGDIVFYPNHASFMGILFPGFITIKKQTVEIKYFVTGGYIDINNNVLNILADEVVEPKQITKDFCSEKIEQLQKETANTSSQDSKLKNLSIIHKYQQYLTHIAV